MTISIITLFPEMFKGVFDLSIISRAQKKRKLKINIINLRDFGIGKHKTVDDKPYGGGAGMILKVDVLHKAITSIQKKEKNTKVILLDPKGKKYNQQTAINLSKENHIILICGHYEGYDERIKNYIDEEISIGDYVLSGGEIPAMIIVDSIARLIPGVLKKQEAVEIESFSEKEGGKLLEYPQYTRPEVYNKYSVPKILLSGNHKKITEFRKKESIKLTKKRRPDLLKDKIIK
ncbi:tRNA (guanosine(37)-N1)-methyltransferase TrmD [Candidatus Parcubacteria bacterium]|nr:MAG: tRNA (guanosine(37)-N1)-methyltransferase TrmD [Candidatus Parcubacteria bacterium]